jgi:hypothetical protein
MHLQYNKKAYRMSSSQTTQLLNIELQIKEKGNGKDIRVSKLVICMLHSIPRRYIKIVITEMSVGYLMTIASSQEN